MKTIEIRRHSIRAKPGGHLSQKGVTLARFVGQGLGLFDRVITSTALRALETAVAMGFAVDEQVEWISTTGDQVENEAPWPLSFAAYAEVMGRGGAAARYAANLAEFYENLAARLPEGGAALVVNHGGVAELGALACMPQADPLSWGSHFEPCEGVRLSWENGRFVRAEILRVSTNRPLEG
jgi:broad specificity phosphatase PhoE